MIDERDRLRRAAEHFDPPTDALDRLLRRKDRRDKGRRIAAGALAAVIALSVLGALATAIVRDDATAPGGAGVVSAAPTIAYGAFVPVDGAFPHLRSIAAAAPGFVAVGDTSDWGQTDPVWFSADGTSWRRAPESTGPRSANLWEVIAGGPGFVTVGLDGQGEPAAWTSPDGTTWTPASVTLPNGGRDGGSMDGLIRVPGGLLAWGRVGDDAYIWTSIDGTDWRPIADEKPFGGEGEQMCCDVSMSSDGFVAIGFERPSGSLGFGHAVAWTSPDGQSWTKNFLTGPEPLDDWVTAPLRPLVSTDGFLFGSWKGMFASTDGVAWERQHPPAEVGKPFVDEVESGTALVAAAADGTIWISADGGAWVKAGEGPASLYSLAVGPRGLLVLSSPGGDQQAMEFASALD
jgi:hypothetical protein